MCWGGGVRTVGDSCAAAVAGPETGMATAASQAEKIHARRQRRITPSRYVRISAVRRGRAARGRGEYAAQCFRLQPRGHASPSAAARTGIRLFLIRWLAARMGSTAREKLEKLRRG